MAPRGRICPPLAYWRRRITQGHNKGRRSLYDPYAEPRQRETAHQQKDPGLKAKINASIESRTRVFS